MIEFVSQNFFLLDYAIGSLILFTLTIAVLTGKLSPYYYLLFWLGVGLGAVWEVSINYNIEFSKVYPVGHFLQPRPVHFLLHSALHSFWHGGLFLAGIGLVRVFSKAPWFTEFRLSEFLILIHWGQFQKLSVELISTYFKGWEWLPYWWNPTLFVLNERHITFFPQLSWVLAIICFYSLAVYVRKYIRD